LRKAWTRTLRRPSGSFRVRMIMQTMPTSYMSSGPGSSRDASFVGDQHEQLVAGHGIVHRTHRSRPAEQKEE